MNINFNGHTRGSTFDSLENAWEEAITVSANTRETFSSCCHPPKGTLHICFRERSTGQDIQPPQHLQGSLGSTYSVCYGSVGPEITGYTYYFHSGAPFNGTFESQPQTLIYLYDPANPLPRCGSLLIQYMDVDSQLPIAADQILTGPVGSPYQVPHGSQGPFIEGYTFQYVTGACPQGIFSIHLQTITYCYVRQSGRVLIKFLEKCTGTALAEPEVLCGPVGCCYKSPHGHQGRPIEGYHLVCIRGQVCGTFTNQVKNLTYLYQKPGGAGLPCCLRKCCHHKCCRRFFTGLVMITAGLITATCCHQC